MGVCCDAERPEEMERRRQHMDKLQGSSVRFDEQDDYQLQGVTKRAKLEAEENEEEYQMREPENEPYMKSKEQDHFNVTPVKADEREDAV